MSSLEGKIAVITGGSSGIGLATAKRFVPKARTSSLPAGVKPNSKKAKREIGRNVTAVQGDVSDLADLDKLYAQVKAEKGVIDIVFASAGFIEHAHIFDLSEAHYDKTMDINVKGVVFTVQKALPLMTRGGSIIVVSSIINVKGVPAHGTYAAAKAGVRASVRVWTQELKDRGIRVNTLSPGATETLSFAVGSIATKPRMRREGRICIDDAAWPSRSPGRACRGRATSWLRTSRAT